jgi:steroid delta-isomerase-like uncharacterized protein
MSVEQNKVLARRIVEEMWNTRNLQVIDEVYDPQAFNHTTVKQFVMGMLAAFPDLHITIENQLAEGDLVATRYITDGTHQGPFEGLPATGKHLNMMGIEMHRFINGKLVQLWNVFDRLSLLQQMGVIPTPGDGSS